MGKATVIDDGDTWRFVREGGRGAVIVRHEAARLGKSKILTKLFTFCFQKMATQNYPEKIDFPLQDLVDLGAYASTQSVMSAIRNFFERQGAVMVADTARPEECGALFYGYEVTRKGGGRATLLPNHNLDWETMGASFAAFPAAAYSLRLNAFNIMRRIFHHVQGGGEDHFSMGLESVREYLGIRPPDAIKDHFKQVIIDPIEGAVDEINAADGCGVSITPRGTQSTKIDQWLRGSLEVEADPKTWGKIQDKFKMIFSS